MQAILDNIIVKSTISDSESGIGYGEVESIGMNISQVLPGNKVYFSLCDYFKINKFPEFFYVIKESAVLAIDNQ